MEPSVHVSLPGEPRAWKLTGTEAVLTRDFHEGGRLAHDHHVGCATAAPVPSAGFATVPNQPLESSGRNFIRTSGSPQGDFLAGLGEGGGVQPQLFLAASRGSGVCLLPQSDP